MGLVVLFTIITILHLLSAQFIAGMVCGIISHYYKILGLSRWYSHSKAIQLGRAVARIQSQICWISKAGVLHLQHHALPR